MEIGDKIDWISRVGKIRYSVIISTIIKKNNICKIKPDYTGKNPMPFPYFWIEFDEVLIRQY